MRQILIKSIESYYVLTTNENEEMLIVQYINNMKKRYSINQILSEIVNIYDVKVNRIKNIIEVNPK